MLLPVYAIIRFYERIGDAMRSYWHKDRLTFLVALPTLLFFSLVLVPVMLKPVVPVVVTVFAMQLFWWPPLMIFIMKELGWDK